MKHFLRAGLLLCAVTAAAQDGPRPSVYGVPNAVGPAPTAAGLGRYGEIPVSHYTGVPQISLPLHQFSTGGAPLAIALSYHAGGIRVEEEAGPVGLGWSLQAGGVITRTVNGLPDETHHGGYGGGPITDPDHPTFNAGQVAEVNRAVQSGLWYGQAQYELVKTFADGLNDGEPDDYYVNFAGHAGRLFFDPERHAFVSPVSFWKIDGYPDVAPFIITDEQGVRYVFGTPEITQTATYSYTSSWYLTRIEYPNREQVRFTYAEDFTKNVTVVPESRAELVGATGAVVLAAPATNEGPPDVSTTPWRLTAVASRTDSVAFAYSRRQDSDQSKLDSVGVWTPSGQHRQSWRFTYAYAGGESFSQGAADERLLLRTLQRVGEPPHTFDYNPNPNPSFPSSRYRQDHWGYLNSNTQGQNNGPTLLPSIQLRYGRADLFFEGADRTPNAAAVAYALRQVQYPTGGRTDYTYEANDYGYDVDRKPVSDTLWTSHQISAQVNGSVNQTQWRPTMAFVLDHTQVVAFKWSDSCSGTDPVFPTVALLSPNGQRYHEFPDKSPPPPPPSNGPGSTGPPKPTTWAGLTRLVLPAGRYVLACPDSAGALAPNNSVYASAAYTSIAGTSKCKKTGGLRIAALAHYDGTSPRPVRTQRFTYHLPGDPERSSGMQTSPEPVYGHYVTLLDPQTQSTSTYYMYSSRPGSSLGTTQGGVVGYRAVAVQTDSTGSNGREEFVFSSLFDRPNSAVARAATRFPYAPGNGHEEELGLLLRHRVFRAAPGGLQLVQEDRHRYNFSRNTLAKTIYGAKVAYAIIPMRGASTGGMFDGAIIDWADARFVGTSYGYSTAWVHPTDEVRVQYDPQTGDSLVSRTAYTYDIRSGQVVRTVRPLADRTLVTRTHFPAEYDTTTISESRARAVRNLVRYHQLTDVVEQQQWVQRGQDSVLVSAQATLYQILPGGPRLVVPEQRLQLRTAAPLASGQYAPATVTGTGRFAVDARLQPTLISDRYDAWGHLLQGHAPGGPFVSYVWGYRSTLPVAKIQNASFAQVQAALGGDPDLLTTDAQLRAAAARLRAQLPFARTTGYTHAPLIGLTSQTDPAGRTTTYEYDGLNRLVRVRDEQGRILSQQQYHYAGQ